MTQFEPFERVLLTIEYDGHGFAGWQRQSNFRTVQAEIEQALSRAVGRETTIWGASRTDSGVNALGQRAHFHNYSTIPPEKFPFVLNTLLPRDVRVTAARAVPEWLHARFSCRGKIYTYRIWNSRHASAIRRHFTTHVPVPVDEYKMQEAAKRLLGTHDFAAFQASGGTAKTTIRSIYGVDITRCGDDVTMVVRGNAFLYNMVRIMAGTLIAVGQDKLSPDCIDEALATGDRLALGVTAPPDGLELTRIFYDLDGERPPEGWGGPLQNAMENAHLPPIIL
ncbi:MAG: tRNA pseudouridine(38-40) synthase TruA [Clostridia bacterium]|nr:tRNA pseudouridine(38-40) synthase TruA [Clostridia bacterium]